MIELANKHDYKRYPRAQTPTKQSNLTTVNLSIVNCPTSKDTDIWLTLVWVWCIQGKCLYVCIAFFFPQYSSVHLVHECVSMCLLGAVSSEERGEKVWVCCCLRMLYCLIEVEGLKEVWKGQGKLAKPEECRIEDMKLSLSSFQISRHGLQMLLHEGPKKKWMTSADSKEQHTPIQLYSVVSKASAHPAPWNY